MLMEGEMSAIKDGRTTIMLDKQRHLLFSLNVIDEVQDRFQDIEALPAKLQGKNGIKTLRWLLTLLLNEGRDEAEPELTEQQVGHMIHVGNMAAVKDAIFASFTVGNGGAETAHAEPDDEGE